MFRSIFAKYFSVTSIVILISFILTGTIQVLLFRVYWVTEKEELLRATALRLAERTANKVTVDPENPDRYNMEPEIMAIVDMVSGTIDGNVFIVGNTGKLIVSNSSGSRIFIDFNEKQLPANLTAKMQSGTEIKDKKDLFGFLSDSHYTVGVPVNLPDKGQLGYVFASISTQSLATQTVNNMQVVFLSTLGVLMATFITVYIITYRLVRPLREMASATRLFGMGDFSYRIPIRGNDEVAELALALNSMAVSLSSVEDVRRSFIANVSHELKTPMTTISGFIDGILDETIPPDKYKHYMRLVSDEVKRLSRLVTSMLELSRLDNKDIKTNLTNFDITELVCHTILTFEQKIEQKKVSVEGLDLSPALYVLSDRDLIGQVIYNLVENAVKFVNEEGNISIHLFGDEGKVYFTIKNTGEGIPAHEMPHIFEKFYKSDKSRGLDKKGLGLGLYIVKTIVNICSGEIQVRSVEGEFCEFEIWLPAAKEIEGSGGNPPKANRAGSDENGGDDKPKVFARGEKPSKPEHSPEGDKHSRQSKKGRLEENGKKPGEKDAEKKETDKDAKKYISSNYNPPEAF